MPQESLGKFKELLSETQQKRSNSQEGGKKKLPLAEVKNSKLNRPWWEMLETERDGIFLLRVWGRIPDPKRPQQLRPNAVLGKDSRVIIGPWIAELLEQLEGQKEEVYSGNTCEILYLQGNSSCFLN